MPKKFSVEVVRDKKSKGTSKYRNVHNVETIEGGVLRLKVRENTIILMSPWTWETCRIDEM